MSRLAAIMALAVTASLAAGCSIAEVPTDPAGAARVGGSLNVDGPLRVIGDTRVGGSAVVYGPVIARSLHVGGSALTTLPQGEPPGISGQQYTTPLVVGGSPTVHSPLIVDGSLRIGGSLQMEPMPDARGDFAPPQSRSGQMLTE